MKIFPAGGFTGIHAVNPHHATVLDTPLMHAGGNRARWMS
jgi:hypothetical protein